MIAEWMLTSAMFAVLVGVAALTAERVQRARGRAVRGVWMGALAAAVLWPAIVPVARGLLPDRASTQVVISPASEAMVLEALSSTTPLLPWWTVTIDALLQARDVLVQRMSQLLASLGLDISDALLLLWALASGWMLVQLVMAARRVRVLTQAATPTQLDGVRVLLSESFGPATIGWRTPHIVVPSWVLSLDTPLRSLVLQHEREHCRAADPRAVWIAAIAVALVPWNPGVWWITRRLRLAIELDCDARTLAAPPAMVRDVRRTYGKLLLFMTQQRTAVGSTLQFATSLSASLASSRSHLRTRITAMQQSPVPESSPSARRQRVVFGALSLVAIVAACGTNIPGNLASPSAVETDVATADVALADDATATKAARERVAAQARVTGSPSTSLPHMVRYPMISYPPALRLARVEGSVLLEFLVNADGSVDPSSVKVLETDHDEFSEAVLTGVAGMGFELAAVDGRAVPRRVQQRFSFRTDFDRITRAGTPGEVNVVLRDGWEGLTTPDQAFSASTPKASTQSMSPEVYFEFQVEKPASMRGAANLRYPQLLRDAQVEGTVLAQFELGTDGRVDMSSFTVLRSDHALFTESVREALPRIEYTPAEVKGMRVKQLVQQPFVFNMAR